MFLPVRSDTRFRAQTVDRQFAITALPASEHQTVHRTVHRLHVVRAVVHFHRWVHAIGVVVKVSEVENNLPFAGAE